VLPFFFEGPRELPDPLSGKYIQGVGGFICLNRSGPCFRVASWKTQAAYDVCIVVVLILGLAQNRRGLRLLGGNPVNLDLGEISYSLYKRHWFITTNTKPVGRNALPKGNQVFVLLGAVWIGASLRYHGGEQLSRRRLRDCWRSDGVAEGTRA
jgi:peptidoglycan/LPS O-acetylase OafA/YrhL